MWVLCDRVREAEGSWRGVQKLRRHPPLNASRRRRSRRRRSQFLQWHRGVSQPFADVLPRYLASRLSWIELLEPSITALAYSPELAFLSFGGRWRGSFGSYLNKSGLDRAGAGLS